MIADQPAMVVHKRPAEGQMSATLFSGARWGGCDRGRRAAGWGVVVVS